MQIVIDIPEEAYKRGTLSEYFGCWSMKLHDAILNGTPLPKGHGRLIDADYLDVTTITTDDYSGNEILDVILKEDLDDAPTIVEADTESEEQDDT